MKVESLVKIIGADFYTGVPDSQLKALCNYLMDTYGIDKKHHIIALSCLLRDSTDNSIFLQNTLFFRDLDKICFSAQRFSRGDQFQTSADRSAFFCLNKD